MVSIRERVKGRRMRQDHNFISVHAGVDSYRLISPLCLGVENKRPLCEWTKYRTKTEAMKAARLLAKGEKGVWVKDCTKL